MVLVMSSYRQLAVGDVVENMTDAHCRRHPEQRMRIVGEATEAEYRQCIRDQGGEDDTPFWQPVYFYKILTD